MYILPLVKQILCLRVLLSSRRSAIHHGLCCRSAITRQPTSILSHRAEARMHTKLHNRMQSRRAATGEVNGIFVQTGERDVNSCSGWVPSMSRNFRQRRRPTFARKQTMQCANTDRHVVCAHGKTVFLVIGDHYTIWKTV